MSIYEGRGAAILYASTPPALLAIVLQLVDFDTLRPRTKTIVVLFVVFYLYILIKTISSIYKNTKNPLRRLPQSSDQSFLLGHARATWREPKGSSFLHWINTIPNNGLIYYAGFFRGPHVFLTTPEAIREVLINHPYDYVKPELGRKFLAQTAGEGLVVVEGDKHKLQRKSVTPAFSGKHVRELVPLFWRKAGELVDVLAEQLSGEERTGVVELNHWASRATIDIICAASLGRDFDSLHNPNDELALQYKRVFGDSAGAMIWILFDMFGTPPPIWLARWTPYFTKFREAAEGRYQLRPLCRKLVEMKRKDIDTGSTPNIDILSVLIRSNEFTDDGLVDQLLTFLAAGHETTSSAFAFTCYLLATHPTQQTRLRNELKTTNLEATDLDTLPYLTAIISEQLRLYPSAPILPRVAIHNTTILNTAIPKDQFVLLCPWAINRSKALWGEDAESFKPERWLEEEVSGDPMRFLTFLHGPRSCIGQQFSRLELKCLVARMVMRFEIRMEDEREEVVPRGFITVKPMGKDGGGLRVGLREL